MKNVTISKAYFTAVIKTLKNWTYIIIIMGLKLLHCFSVPVVSYSDAPLDSDSYVCVCVLIYYYYYHPLGALTNLLLRIILLSFYANHTI